MCKIIPQCGDVLLSDRFPVVNDYAKITFLFHKSTKGDGFLTSDRRHASFLYFT